jgi:hypothetical protein
VESVIVVEVKVRFGMGCGLQGRKMDRWAPVSTRFDSNELE